MAEAKSVIEDFFTRGLSVDLPPIKANFPKGGFEVHNLIAVEIENSKVISLISL